MAKGFTVKANTPKPKEAEWDIDAIKERMKGKTIVFCLPGRGCSYIFLKNFVQLCFDMVQNGMSIQISQDYSSMVNFARCKCLGANVLRGPKQVPWDGKLEYDYQLWIDSDIVFNTSSSVVTSSLIDSAGTAISHNCQNLLESKTISESIHS